MIQERCPATFKEDGGTPLPCRRETGHPGFHSATDEVWWTNDGAAMRQLAEHLSEIGYDVVNLDEDPEAGWRIE